MGAVLETLTINHPSAKQPRQVRLSRNIRRVIDATVFDGAKLVDALQIAGITRGAYNLASRKPEFTAYQQEAVRVLRTSAAARSIGRVDRLADDAASEHVQLEANKWLAGIEGISPIVKSENMHVHQHVIPGLVVHRHGWQQPGDDALLIGDHQVVQRITNPINVIGTPVLRKTKKNAQAVPEIVDVAAQPKRGGRGAK